MIYNLKSILENKCSTFEMWLATFDNFINYQPRDSNIILEKYKNSPDYCTWEIDDDITTISYRYVHRLCSNGDMHCLQEYSDKKYQSLIDYKTLELNLPTLETLSIEGDLLYTKFTSPTGCLGYPPPYKLLTIMYSSNNVVVEFHDYITAIIDNYVELFKRCIHANIPFYSPARTMTSHYIDSIFYFKDTVFFSSNEDITIDDIADTISSNIDGFRRAKGIISAYQGRGDSRPDVVDLLYKEIDNLKNYARMQCLNLKNVNL